MTTLDQLLSTLPQPAQGVLRATLSAQHIDLTAAVVDSTVIPAGSDLAKFAYVDGAKYTTVPGAHYTVAGTWNTTCANVSIDGTASFLDGNLLTNGGSSLIDAKGAPNFSFANFSISAPANATIMRLGPLGAFTGNTILTSVATVCDCTYPQANGAVVAKNIQKMPSGSRFCLINGADDVTISENQIAGSIGEDAIRAMPETVTGHVPARTTIQKNVIGFASTNHKSSISLREATDAIISGNDITGWVRLGEASGAITVPNVAINGNILRPDPNNNDQISCMAATAKIDKNIFLLNSTQRAISGSGASRILSCDGNTKSAKSGVATKKLINWSGQITPAAPHGESDGTHTTPAIIP